MSTGFRRVLSGTVTRLQLRVTSAEADLAEADVDPVERVKTAKIHFNSISRMLETVDRQRAQWTNWMLELQEAERLVANAEFEEFANQPDSYIVVAERARDMLDSLDSVIIRNRTSRSTHSSQSSSHSDDEDVPGPSGAIPRRLPTAPPILPAAVSPHPPGPGRDPHPPLPPLVAPDPAHNAPAVLPINLGQLRLPKWKLIIFCGEGWVSYWQCFYVAVHIQPIPAIQKMVYLISSLKGEPLKDIQSLSVTNENYPIAVRLLADKYGDDGELEDRIHLELQNIPAASESLSSLIELSQSFERRCHQLEEMKISTCNTVLTALLKSKIPKGARGRLTEKEAESGRRWNTDDWRKGLQLLIKIRKRNQVSLTSDTPEKEKENLRKGSRRRGKPPPVEETTRTFAVTQQQQPPAKGKSSGKQQPKRKLQCLLCSGEHWPSACPQFSEPDKRRQRIGALNRCYICLKEGHRASECSSGKKCRHCDSPTHHSLTCKQGPHPSTGSNREPVGKPRWTPPPTAANAVAEETSNHAVVEKPTEILLMAARIPVSAGRREELGIVFFDCGSQRSYITNQFARRLNARKIAKNDLSLFTFGSDIPTRLSSPRYSVELRDNDNRRTAISVSGIDKISEGVTAVIGNYRPDLPEPMTPRVHKPDILIGMADFWKFFRGMQHVEKDIYQIWTTFGPLFCGRREAQVFKDPTTTAMSVVEVPSSDEPGEPEESTETDDIKGFWDLETLGIKDDPTEDDDVTAMQMFKESLQLIDGRYQVAWPGKNKFPICLLTSD